MSHSAVANEVSKPVNQVTYLQYSLLNLRQTTLDDFLLSTWYNSCTKNYIVQKTIL